MAVGLLFLMILTVGLIIGSIIFIGFKGTLILVGAGIGLWIALMIIDKILEFYDEAPTKSNQKDEGK